MDCNPTRRRVAARAISVLVFALALGIGFGGPATAQGRPIDFQREVLSVLERRCFECHRTPSPQAGRRTKRPKAGLALDGKTAILKGSSAGAVLVPGKPEESLLYTLTVLPKNDPDLMPANGDPLTKKETESLRRWIEQGASFGSWEGVSGRVVQGTAGKDRDRVPSKVALLERLGQGVPRVDAELLDRVEKESLATISPSLPGSPLLRVEFVSREDSIGDRRVEVLQEISGNIALLDLGKSKVTDTALGWFRKMTRITHLDLHRTAITDAGLAQLVGLPELRVLNLYGTEVTDAGLESLAQMKALRTLYLWQTEVSEGGVGRLQEKLPETRIVFRLDLPPVPTNERSGRGDRRR